MAAMAAKKKTGTGALITISHCRQPQALAPDVCRSGLYTNNGNGSVTGSVHDHRRIAKGKK